MVFVDTYSHVGIVGNEMVDHLTYSTKCFINFSPFKILFSDLLPIHNKLIWNNWQSNWSSFPPFYASLRRTISPLIFSRPYYWALDLSRFQIVAFFHIRFGNNLISNHSYKLSLNSSPICSLNTYTLKLCVTFTIIFWFSPSLDF